MGARIQVGIPIDKKTNALYPVEVQTAWKLFHKWFMTARVINDSGFIDRKTMPENVREAMELILKTPIPGREDGATGKESCYMIHVFSQLTPE